MTEVGRPLPRPSDETVFSAWRHNVLNCRNAVVSKYVLEQGSVMISREDRFDVGTLSVQLGVKTRTRPEACRTFQL